MIKQFVSERGKIAPPHHGELREAPAEADVEIKEGADPRADRLHRTQVR